MPTRIDARTFQCGQRSKSPGCCFDHWAKPSQKFYRKAKLVARHNGNRHQVRQYASQHLNMTGNEYTLALKIAGDSE